MTDSTLVNLSIRRNSYFFRETKKEPDTRVKETERETTEKEDTDKVRRRWFVGNERIVKVG